MRFDYGPKGDFFVRAKATEGKDQVCYSDYYKVHVDSDIAWILIMGDQRKDVTYKINMEMGKYTEFKLTIMD